jgi:class 3 adenylate cyclase
VADPPRIRASGAFADPALEREFQAENLPSLARFLRFSLGLATLVFLAYGVHDWLVVPSVKERAWMVRYGVFLPVAAAALALVGSAGLARFGQAAMLGYGAAASFVVLYIGAISPPHGYFLYTSYALVFVTLGPFVARMNVTTQTAYTLLTLALYNLLEAALVNGPLAVRASISITIVSLGGIGALLAYQLERQSRESFLQRRAIRRLLLNVLPERIAERLEVESGAIAEGHPRISVLFADIVGFTRMTQRIAPEELVERLNLVFSSFDDLADKLELEKIKTIGDAYMVAAGLGSHAEDHALAIAEMALAMQRRVADFSQRFGEPLTLRIGIDSGPVVAGVIGKRKFSYDVWGDTVNTASRMESHAEPGTIQVTEATHALLKHAYELSPRGEIEIKGKGKMKTWVLAGRLPEADGRRSAKTRVPWKLGEQSG